MHVLATMVRGNSLLDRITCENCKESAQRILFSVWPEKDCKEKTKKTGRQPMGAVHWKKMGREAYLESVWERLGAAGHDVDKQAFTTTPSDGRFSCKRCGRTTLMRCAAVLVASPCMGEDRTAAHAARRQREQSKGSAAKEKKKQRR